MGVQGKMNGLLAQAHHCRKSSRG